MVSSLSLLLIILINSSSLISMASTRTTKSSVHGQPITAVYAFGDSTVDPGNNNNLPNVLFHANHPPYGINLPNHKPTGRFSDGLLATDFLVRNLGLKSYLPAYLSIRNTQVESTEVLTGVSFASAGAGLDDSTLAFTTALGLNQQLEQFEEAYRRMVEVNGEEKAVTVVKNALFLVSIGSNDMVLNCFDTTGRSLCYSLGGYEDVLLIHLRQFMGSLYNHGARKFAIAGLPPIGCLPMQMTLGSLVPRAHMPRRSCVTQQNDDSQLYNDKLQHVIISTFEAQNHGAKIAYLDIYNPLMDMIERPDKYGFVATLEGCCGSGAIEEGALCNFLFATCSDPSKYVFWDAMHPTQAASAILARVFYDTALPKLMI